jgi:tetratricopeptide (TPR) repeat protein
VNLKLGTLYWQRDECGKAIGVLSDVRGNDPKALVVRGFLADCYFKSDQRARAYQLYTDILRVQPGNVLAVTGIAQIHHAKGETETAETILASITTPQTPVYVPAYRLLAQIQRATGKLDAAIHSYTVILRQPGNEKEALLALSEVYLAKGQPAKAVETLERARAYFPLGDPTVDRRLSAIQTPR